MEALSVPYVEARRGVVDLVKRPQDIEAMHAPMMKVADQVVIEQDEDIPRGLWQGVHADQRDVRDAEVIGHRIHKRDGENGSERPRHERTIDTDIEERVEQVGSKLGAEPRTVHFPGKE